MCFPHMEMQVKFFVLLNKKKLNYVKLINHYLNCLFHFVLLLLKTSSYSPFLILSFLIFSYQRYFISGTFIVFILGSFVFCFFVVCILRGGRGLVLLYFFFPNEIHCNSLLHSRKIRRGTVTLPLVTEYLIWNCLLEE